MERYVLDLDLVQTKVREFAALAPEFTYNAEFSGGCVYTPDYDNPVGCLIGAALLDMNLPPEWGDTKDWDDTGSVECLIDWWDSNGFDVTGTMRCRDWLRDVQAAQDGGANWADAVRIADGEELD